VGSEKRNLEPRLKSCVESRHFEPAYRQVGDFAKRRGAKLYREVNGVQKPVLDTKCLLPVIASLPVDRQACLAVRQA